MQRMLSVMWRITPLDYPRISRRCPNCARKTQFQCSGKFRINAQKQRLDIWLIYRCDDCSATWNYPLFERCAVRDIDAALLAAVSHNNSRAVQSFAFDLARLRPHVDHVDAGTRLHIEKRVERTAVAEPDSLCITIELSAACKLRLDRLLAGELGLSRAELGDLHAKGDLIVAPPSRKALRRPISDGQRIQLDLRAMAGIPDAIAAVLRGSF